MFRRIHISNTRGEGQQVRIGNIDAADKRRGRDNRPLLNVAGTYTVKTISGENANIEVVVNRNALPAVKGKLHNQDILVPINQIARSINTDEAGRPIRV
jgi:hypothetical protein